jgi:hypothetical protein
MSVQAEREPVAAEFDDQLENLKQLQARIAATDERLAVIRDAIREFGCRSVAQALQETPARDDSIAPHPSKSPTGRAAGVLRWVLVMIVTLPVLVVSLNGLKPPASKARSPVARSTSSQPVTSQPVTSEPVTSEPVTTAIAPRDNQPALPDVADTSSGLRRSEPSTDAPPQEEAQMRIRSSLPPSEDDATSVEPRDALSPPPIPTPATVDTPATLPTPLLDLGQIEDAKRVQRRLIELGFLFATAHGTWGPRSRTALRDFRSAQGIGNNDTWDEKAQQDLFSATAARAPAMGTFVGGWGANPDQCRSPVTISAGRAEALSTTCQFNSTQRESANEWRIRATCADEHDRWNANIRLTLAGRRLTWASERGTVTYLRCPVIWN